VPALSDLEREVTGALTCATPLLEEPYEKDMDPVKSAWKLPDKTEPNDREKSSLPVKSMPTFKELTENPFVLKNGGILVYVADIGIEMLLPSTLTASEAVKLVPAPNEAEPVAEPEPVTWAARPPRPNER